MHARLPRRSWCLPDADARRGAPSYSLNSSSMVGGSSTSISNECTCSPCPRLLLCSSARASCSSTLDACVGSAVVCAMMGGGNASQEGRVDTGSLAAARCGSVWPGGQKCWARKMKPFVPPPSAVSFRRKGKSSDQIQSARQHRCDLQDSTERADTAFGERVRARLRVCV